MDKMIDFIKFLFYAIIILMNLTSCKDSSIIKNKRNHKISTKSQKKNSIINNDTIPFDYKEIFKLKKNKNISKLAYIYFNMGLYFLNKSKSDSAFYYFNHSKEAFLIENNYKFIGKSLINIAITQANEGDYIGSEESAVEALRYIKDLQNNTLLSAAYNCLAISKTELKDYDEAIKYYNMALQSSTNKISSINIKNNVAVVNIKAGNYINAIKILNNLNKDPFLSNLPLHQARIIDNLAYAKWLLNPYFKADKDFYYSLKVREQYSDLLGQIANHYHLSEYYENNNAKKAIFHANKMYDIALKLGNLDDQQVAIKKIIPITSQSSSIKYYFNLYEKISDSINSKRVQAKNKFALMSYEVERNKEENASLKAENAQKSYQLLKQSVIFGSLSFLAILILVFLIFWYQRRKAKFRQEKTEEVHRTKLKYSKKIHDEVANGIYFLMVQLENNSDIRPTKIIDELELLYQKSRDISHDAEFNLDLKDDFSITLRNMIKPYGAKYTKIILIGNEPHIWENISINKKEEIYYILKELMTNMKKHSKADIVTLKFKKEDSTIIIEYSDNGIGLSGSFINSYKDLTDIEKRLNPIQGSYFIDSEKKRGFAIKIIISI